jgi:hypothetical protein
VHLKSGSVVQNEFKMKSPIILKVCFVRGMTTPIGKRIVFIGNVRWNGITLE